VVHVTPIPKQIGVGGNRIWRPLMIQGPLGFHSVHVLAIDRAHLLRGTGNGVSEARDGDGRKQADNGNDDHDFDQRKGGSRGCLHIAFIGWFC